MYYIIAVLYIGENAEQNLGVSFLLLANDNDMTNKLKFMLIDHVS